MPNFLDVDINDQHEPKRAEHFDASLSRLNSIEKLSAYADSIAAFQQINPTDPRYLLLLEKVTAERFYHGFSHYTVKENWSAAIGEKVFGNGLSCIVKPEDIMKKPKGACSQQSIVMMALLRKKHIDYRKVGFPHHFAVGARFKDKWYFADADQEPDIPLAARQRENWKGEADNLKPYYNSNVYPNLDFGFGVRQIVETGSVNEVPARRLSFFHSFTLLCSRFSWCLPLIFMFVYARKKDSKAAIVVPMKQPSAMPQVQHRFYIS